MNAYELAYKLNNALGVDYEMLEQSSIMLRQQADRIAELEKLTREPTKVFAVPDLMAKAGFFKRGERVASQIQTKPLSDEEIHELANEHLRTQNQDGAKVVLGLEDFARAIEERHGIK